MLNFGDALWTVLVQRDTSLLLQRLTRGTSVTCGIWPTPSSTMGHHRHGTAPYVPTWDITNSIQSNGLYMRCQFHFQNFPLTSYTIAAATTYSLAMSSYSFPYSFMSTASKTSTVYTDTIYPVSDIDT